MREFARLYAELDETTATNRKLEALQNYFASAAPENAAWAVYFLAGGKPRQAVPSKLLRQYAIEYAGLDEWLFDESYAAVGDMAETIAHILPPPKRHSDVGLAVWMEERIGPLRGADPGTIREALFSYWDELTWRERFLFVKLIGGGFRVGVSKLLVTRALASIAAVDSKLIAQRLMGWTDGRVKPTAAGFLQLIAAQTDNEHQLRGGQPYPFFLAHQLQGEPAALGDMGDWQVEWKYDGIRAQLVRRGGQNYLWSRGEDLITERFPELAGLSLPEGTVIDGEVLIWTTGDAPAPFAAPDCRQSARADCADCARRACPPRRRFRQSDVQASCVASPASTAAPRRASATRPARSCANASRRSSAGARRPEACAAPASAEPTASA